MDKYSFKLIRNEDIIRDAFRYKNNEYGDAVEELLRKLDEDEGYGPSEVLITQKFKAELDSFVHKQFPRKRLEIGDMKFSVSEVVDYPRLIHDMSDSGMIDIFRVKQRANPFIMSYLVVKDLQLCPF